jgi:Kef-type K+ transport system membrane component KefB
MNSIETIICLILLLMAVPDLCRKLGRPALANVCFVVFGLALGPLVQKDVATMVKEAGEVGFLLVLFEVGLEINLPKLRELLPSLRFAALWLLVQYPLVVAVAMASRLTLPEGLLAASALTSCSMSMAYFGWKHYPGFSEASRVFTLQVMIALEVLALVVLSIGSVAVEDGFGGLIFLKLAGMAVTIFLISRFATHLMILFQWIIEKTTRWRVHFLVLLVLVICAVGERLGLAASKTAFFLGLFMSRAQFEGKGVEEYIAPISRRFLIPVFFVSLGLLVDWHMLFSYMALLALGGAILLIGFREVMHRRWLATGGDAGTYLLFCPNLTLAALAATALLAANSRDAATWVVLSGLFISIISLLLLPRVAEEIPRPEKILSAGAEDDFTPLFPPTVKTDSSPDRKQKARRWRS